MTPKFKIGDRVFKVRYDKNGKDVICPDCLGTAHVRMLLGDGTELTIECGGCDPGGYRGSTGKIKQYEYSTRVIPHKVTGICLTTNSVSYELDKPDTGGCYFTGTEDDIFQTEEEAFADGERQRIEHEADENKTLMAKTKGAKSWAFNATYHRQCIKRLEKELEYHRSKVQICAAKTKEAA